MSISTLPTIQTLSDPFYSTDVNNPASALFVPPAGTYQNNNGQIVPNSTPSSTAGFGATGATGAVGSGATGAQGAGGNTSTSSSNSQSIIAKWFGLPSLENVIFIVLGLLLIAAGIFSFDKTQQLIQSAGKVAEVAAA